MALFNLWSVVCSQSSTPNGKFFIAPSVIISNAFPLPDRYSWVFFSQNTSCRWDGVKDGGETENVQKCPAKKTRLSLNEGGHKGSPKKHHRAAWFKRIPHFFLQANHIKMHSKHGTFVDCPLAESQSLIETKLSFATHYCRYIVANLLWSTIKLNLWIEVG